MSDFTINPLSEVLGAEVVGLDLRNELSATDKKRVFDAFDTYHVLCFRDQSLSKDEQLEATKQFGELDVHVQSNRSSDIPLIHIVSNMDENDIPRQSIAGRNSVHWHSDKSYRRKPSLATFLYSLEVPAEGGETQFSNTLKAFAALPEERQERLQQLKVVHSWPDSKLRATGTPASDEEIASWPPMPQPLTRTHPPSGKKAIFIGQHASWIEGEEDKGRGLIEELEEWCVQDRFVYNHQWRVGDMLMWDNRCLLHRAAPYDGDKYRRLMHRTVTQGDACF